MALKSYQTQIEPNKLYSVQVMGGVSGNGAQIAPSIEVIGEADIYGSQTEPLTPTDGMFQTKAGFSGIETFAVIPNYLYVSGNPDSIVLSGVEAVEVTSDSPPVAGALDFHSDEIGLTSFTQEFGLAIPQAVVGMGFFFTGTPSFTITHGGEPLEVHAALSNEGVGSLVALGQGLTVETANLEITCTGGTFGGLFGRINEIDYPYTLQWEDYAIGVGQSSPLLSGDSGELITAAHVGNWMASYPYLTPLPVTTWGRIVNSEPFPLEEPIAGEGWTKDGDDWVHTGSQSDLLFPFVSNHVGTACYFGDVDATEATQVRFGAQNPAGQSWLSTVPPTTNGVWGDRIGVSQPITLARGIVRATGNVRLRSINWYDGAMEQNGTVSLGRGMQSQTQVLCNGIRPYAIQAVSIIPS